MSEKELRAMKVSTWGYIDNWTSVLRVPTGWIIYRLNEEGRDYYPQGVFVPLNINVP